MEVEFSKHAIQRYVERIDEKNGIDRDIYIAQNQERIKERLQKLFDSSEEIYFGKMREYGQARIFFNKNGWCLILDANKPKVITLYKCDLKLGEILNKQFWATALAQIEELKNKKNELIEKSNSIKNENLKEIESNNNAIKEYQNIINVLQDRNKMLENENNEYKSEQLITDRKIKETIEALVCERIF